MGTEALKVHNLFAGGISDSKYVNSANKVPFMVGLDLHSEIGIIRANQNLKLLNSGASVPDEPAAKTLVCTNGVTYHFSSESGKIWALSAANAWTLVYTTVPTSGDANILDAEEYSGYIYWTTEEYVHRIRVNRTSGGAADWTTYAEPNYKRLTLDQPEIGFNTDDIGYAIPTTVIEDANNYREFKPVENLLSEIGIYIVEKSTVDITITVHDSGNNVITSKQLLTAAITEGETNYFRFASPVAVDPDLTYHYHVTASAAGGTVGTQISEMGTATMTIASPGVVTFTSHGLVTDDQIYFTTSGALPTGVTAGTPYYVISSGLATDTFQFSTARGGAAVNTSGSQSGVHKLHSPSLGNSFAEIYTKSNDQFHSFAIANGVLYLGDRNYIHQIDYDYRTGEHVFSYFALDIPKHFIVSAIAGYNTSLIIGTFAATNVNKASVFWWNTYSTVSYSYEDSVDEIGIWSFMKMDDTLFCSAGVNGNIYQYVEGRLTPYKQIPGTYDNDNQGYVKLNSSVFYKGAMLFGFSSTTGDPTYNGVYSLLSPLPNYPFVLNLEYAISERNGEELILNEVQINTLAVRGNDLIVSWYRNDTMTCGVDIIDWDNKHDRAQFKTGIVKSSDDINQFRIRKLVVDYAELPGDSDIEIGYHKDYSDTYTVASSLTDSIRKHKVVTTSDQVSAFEGVVKLLVDGNDSPGIFGLYIELD